MNINTHFIRPPDPIFGWTNLWWVGDLDMPNYAVLMTTEEVAQLLS